MLDRRFIVENADAVRENCKNRGVSVDIDRFLTLERETREKDSELQVLNQKANEVSKTIGKAKDATEREERIAEGRRLREARDALKEELEALNAEFREVHEAIPNMSDPAAPIGATDEDNVEILRGQTPVPSFGFEPKDHLEIGKDLDLLDFETAAKVTGHGFYYLKNEGALLELALQQFAVSKLMAEGFTVLTTPDLARNDVLSGTGFSPRGNETQIYSIEGTDLSLIATAEITLGGVYKDTILEEEKLPILLCGLSHCFRTEAGAHGAATRGLYRVHQFSKVEMFAFTTPEQSVEVHETMYRIEREIFDALGLAYRAVDICTGDLGGSAYKKYDLEAWMPKRGENGSWGEVTSTSNCTDYQARRLNIRCRPKGEKGTRLVHTLNGTAVSMARAILAILENYQQADGSVLVPQALRPFMGGKDRIAR
ncbi:MAG: serine--tRNA ligase [Alphaproteobacteria bacterium]|nr:serine--tRNA ligase [Alphaproteobacteria bacterium]